MRRLLCALIPLGLVSLPLPASAQRTQFALACLGTETGYTVNFSWRWGDSGRWTQSSVAPGKWKGFRWNYDYPGENRSPNLNVRYDDDATGGTNYVVTKLAAYAAWQEDCEGQGKTFNFYQRGNELYIQEED